jgi:hypothetical protein
MRSILILIALVVLALPGMAQLETKPSDKDIPLAEAIRQANQQWPGIQPLTELEVTAAVRAMKTEYPNLDTDTYNTYMRIVRDGVLPEGMFFRRITQNDGIQVDWLDLCLEGHVATAKEKEQLLPKLPPNVTMSITRVGGFEYRLRSRFVSSN